MAVWIENPHIHFNRDGKVYTPSRSRQPDIAELVALIDSRGRKIFRLKVSDWTGNDIPHSKLTLPQMKAARVIQVSKPCDVHPCERCGETQGTEEHHWAPRQWFIDAHSWPTSFLCPTCHRKWHRTVELNIKITEIDRTVRHLENYSDLVKEEINSVEIKRRDLEYAVATGGNELQIETKKLLLKFAEKRLAQMKTSLNQIKQMYEEKIETC